MTNTARNKGSAFERLVRDTLRSKEYGYAFELLRTTGAKDEGDGIITPPNYDAKLDQLGLVEIKKTKALNSAGFIKQALDERDNYCAARNIARGKVFPMVIWGPPGKSIHDSLVFTTFREMFGIVE